ncbi:MAG: MalY/PatB family protein [Saccharofermentanales bacterium]
MSFDEIIDRRQTGSLKWDLAPGPVDPQELTIPLSVADMEFRSPPCIREKLKVLADCGIWGYTGPRPQYFQALNRWYTLRHDFPIQADWVVPTTGVVQAVFSAVRAFSKPGDRVLIQTPVYYPFFGAVEQNGRQLTASQLIIRDGRYRIDFDDLEEKIKGASLMILCSPHNPVGRVWDREELSQIARLAARHDVFVISDEIHCDFTFGKKHTVFSRLAQEHGTRHLLAFSASKTFSLAGLKVASIVVPDAGDREIFRKQVRTDGVHTHSTFGFAAAEAAYADCDDWYFAMLDYIKGNFQTLKTFIEEEMPRVTLFDLEGTYLAWLDFGALCRDHRTLEERMIEQRLYLDEGYIFGDCARGFERINLACPRQILSASLERLKKVYDQLAAGSDP